MLTPTSRNGDSWLSKRHAEPNAACVLHSVSRTLTTNQPGVAGTRPDGPASSRASSTMLPPSLWAPNDRGPRSLGEEEVPGSADRGEAQLAVELLRPVELLGDEEGDGVAARAGLAERPRDDCAGQAAVAEPRPREHTLDLPDLAVGVQLAVTRDLAVGVAAEVAGTARHAVD